MRIAEVEIGNFRKLESVRIGFAEKTTLFVGANNSGKTSATDALCLFLKPSKNRRFTINDFTLSHWRTLNEFGVRLDAGGQPPSLEDWVRVTPALDIWLHVENDELHYVSKLIPSLDWPGGLLGVRLRLEPKDLEALNREYIQSRKQAEDTLASAPARSDEGSAKLRLWPEDMISFLGRRLGALFEVRAYSLDPAALKEPKNGLAQRQELPPGAEPMEGNPFHGIIRVDEIGAQRGLGDDSSSDESEDGESVTRRHPQKLSLQLSAYYSSHLDPSKNPSPKDLEALQSFANAQQAFDQRLQASFDTALSELADLGYPGLTDPKVTIATRIQPVEGLKHSGAVQYEVESPKELSDPDRPLRLPEGYNGLGYQNLVSITFRLMGFRDQWMRVGKAAAQLDNGGHIEPLHLVLVEEPEAHLHAQVQQVFIRKAYRILRKHADLGDSTRLRTQMVVSTHSSHVTHEMEFANLRYFRRQPPLNGGGVATSTVANLSNVFGEGKKTGEYVTRYLRTQHCDLFFADAAIVVEGAAERMLLPLFLREEKAFLSHRYITLLEIGGSHAHRLRRLIECLGLTTLVITDLDACNKVSKRAEPPQRNQGQITSNTTLKKWLPRLADVDALLDAKPASKEKEVDSASSAVRVAYQLPVSLNLNGKSQEALAYTFEDALVLENREVFCAGKSTGVIGRFRKAVGGKGDVQELVKAIADERMSCQKAEFAVSLVYSEEFASLKLPAYIREGLEWLEGRLGKKEPVAADNAAVEGDR